MKRHRLLAIWLDGFRTEYLDKQRTPFLHQLSQEALTCEYQPPLAFAGIGASMFTGMSLSKHGIWTEFYYDPDKSPFKWTKKASIVNKSIDAVTDKTGLIGQFLRVGMNLFVFKASNRFSGRTYMPIALKIPTHSLHYFDTSMSFRMLSQEKSFGIPSLFDILRERSIPFKTLEQSKMRDKQILKEALRVDEKARFVFIQFAELDRVGHTKGPCSKEIRRSLITVDNRVQRILEEHKKNFDLDTFIFADHGMIEVERTVDILGELRRCGLTEDTEFMMFLDSSIARIWPQTSTAKNQIMNVFVGLKGGKILSEEDSMRYQIPDDRRYGDVIWLADPGTLVLPNYYQGRKLVHGMHGYAPETRGLWSPCIIHGSTIEARKVKHIAQPMDIFSTILDLLDIPIPHYAEGNSLLTAE